MRWMLALSVSSALSLSGAVASAQAGSGGLFRFFGGRDIDYWNEGKSDQDPFQRESPRSKAPSAPSFSGSTVVRALDGQEFDWTSYRDPRSAQFWDDGGDWIPPRPFREAAANPTSENLDEYLAWQVRKSEVLARFQTGLEQRGQRMVEKMSSKRNEASAVHSEPNWSDVEIIYFYQTSCAHCRASAASIEKVQGLGAKVLFVQLDHRTSPPLHSPSVSYDAQLSREYAVTATPTWILEVRGKRIRHQGGLDFLGIRAALAKLQN